MSLFHILNHPPPKSLEYEQSIKLEYTYIIYTYIFRSRWIKLTPGVTCGVKGDDKKGWQKGKGKVKVPIIV